MTRPVFMRNIEFLKALHRPLLFIARHMAAHRLNKQRQQVDAIGQIQTSQRVTIALV